MWHWIHQAASPKTAYRWAGACQPYFALAFTLIGAYGLVDGFSWAPPDYQQGDVFRIMYLHVPAALWSLLIYLLMAASAVIFLVWKIKIADMLVKMAAPLGALFTFICLLTGALWGRPTWGTWWIWDARLTSELLLLFIYFAIMALRSALPNPIVAAKASAIFTLVGLVNIPIIHYSVTWWSTLHQDSSFSLNHTTISASMLHPLQWMILAFGLYAAWILCIGLRYEILLREQETTWVTHTFHHSP